MVIQIQYGVDKCKIHSINASKTAGIPRSPKQLISYYLINYRSSYRNNTYVDISEQIKLKDIRIKVFISPNRFNSK